MSNLIVGVISRKSAHKQGFGIKTAFDDHLVLLEELKESGKIGDYYYDFDSHYPALSWLDIFHVHTLSLKAYFALKRARKIAKNASKRPTIVISAHIMPETVENMFPLSSIWMPFVRKFMQSYFRLADVLVAISPRNAESLKNLVGEEYAKNVVSLPLHVDISDFKKEKSALDISANPDYKVVVVASGHIQSRKRFDIFFDVALLLPNINFVWVGGVMFKTGAKYSDSKAMLDNLPLNLTVTGLLSRKETAKYIRNADILMMPSDQETFGLAIVEGAASTLPVIARPLDDYNGTFSEHILYADNAEEFATQITKLTENPDLYREYQMHSKEIVNKFATDIKKQADELYKIYFDSNKD